MKLQKRLIMLMLSAFMAGSLLTGCGNNSGDAAPADGTVAETVQETETVAEAATEDTLYFTKGVYINYAKEAENPDKTYFYVFQEDTYGHTDDGATGTGVPFNVEQADGSVSFTFGGEGEAADVLTVSSFENGIVTGHFDDGLELVFERVDGVDADSFDAQDYLSGSEDDIYHDANGWSIKYDPEKFSISQENGQVFIVYQGESAGTNMITVTYDPKKDGKTAVQELGESWGDKTEFSEAPFIGMDAVTGYYATLEPEEGGSGLYMTALGRDYMEGSLVFELTGHNGEDDEMNMAVSDAMSGILDSIEFD